MNAYYNHGRWVVDCSADDCRGALRVPVGRFSSMVMVCNCRDESVCDHQSVPCGHVFEVELPSDRIEIERLAGLRPRRAQRNWRPGETVADMQAENLLHGVSI